MTSRYRWSVAIAVAYAIAGIAVSASCDPSAASNDESGLDAEAPRADTPEAAPTDDASGEIPLPDEACSTGVPYPPWGSSAIDWVDFTGYQGTPECVPHCGVEPGPRGYFFVNALPTGTCVAEGAICQFPAETACGTPYGIGPLHGYACRCREHQWECGGLRESRGGGACTVKGKDAEAE